MKTHSLPLAVLLSAASIAHAVKFPVRQVRSHPENYQRRSGHVTYSRPVVAAANNPDDNDMGLS